MGVGWESIPSRRNPSNIRQDNDMDLLNHELELMSLVLKETISNLNKLAPAFANDVGNLTKDLTKLSNRITKELKARTDMDNLQFEQLANF